MKEIKCPRCGSAFTIDEADYASIVNQVWNAEFQTELEKRIVELNKQHKAQEEAAALRVQQGFQTQLTAKDTELGKKETGIAELKGLIQRLSQAKALEYGEQIKAKEQEILQLRAQLQQADDRQRMTLLQEQNRASQALTTKETEIAE